MTRPGTRPAGWVQQTADDNPDIVFAAMLCDTGKKSLKHARSLNLTLPVMLDPGGAHSLSVSRMSARRPQSLSAPADKS